MEKTQCLLVLQSSRRFIPLSLVSIISLLHFFFPIPFNPLLHNHQNGSTITMQSLAMVHTLPLSCISIMLALSYLNTRKVKAITL
jgi:hypothetical protein